MMKSWAERANVKVIMALLRAQVWALRSNVSEINWVEETSHTHGFSATETYVYDVFQVRYGI